MPRAETALDAARAEEVTTLAALEALRPEWERLWARAPRATPFQSPHWLLPWWKHVGRGTLATIAVRSGTDGELVALAPLYVYADAATGRRHLFPIGIATTDDLDILIAPQWEQRALRCVAAQLARRDGAWDVFEAPQLRDGAALLQLAPPAGWRRELLACEPNPVLKLNGGNADDTLPVPRRMAENIRSCRRRIEREGQVCYELADARTLRDFLDALARLHARRWSARGLPGVLADAGVLAAHAEAAPLLQSAGLLRLHGLRLDGELIAVLYCIVDTAPAHERRCSYYLGGFDPQRSALSPGTLLIAHAIEQARAEGATVFDFLRGAEPYKYRWGAQDQPMFTLRLWPVAVAPA
jgi:CelD/BcsL family acetyltransferase involved in cellulose biosynthesis